MSTQEQDLPYGGTTAQRFRAFATSDDARERVSALAARYWEAAAYFTSRGLRLALMPPRATAGPGGGARCVVAQDSRAARRGRTRPKTPPG